MRVRPRSYGRQEVQVDSDTRLVDFRFGFDDSGAVATVAGHERVKGLILQVLLTTPGERINEPEFGCGLLDLVFEPLSAVTIATLRYRVRRGLIRWLGDLVRVSEVEIKEAMVGDMSCFEIDITYSLAENPGRTESLALRLRRDD
jgi:phage baseplate assembly protein W